MQVEWHRTVCVHVGFLFFRKNTVVRTCLQRQFVPLQCRSSAACWQCARERSNTSLVNHASGKSTSTLCIELSCRHITGLSSKTCSLFKRPPSLALLGRISWIALVSLCSNDISECARALRHHSSRGCCERVGKAKRSHHDMLLLLSLSCQH